MKIEEEDPFGIKNEQLRAIVKAKFERGENFHYRWVPLECIRQVDRLRAILMKSAKEIRCPTLVVHAREDELTSLRSANFLVEQIGGGRARMVVLEDSYHMVCVDNDREIVAKNVLEFFGAALPGATSALANEPKMTRGGARRRGRRDAARSSAPAISPACATSRFPISRGCSRARTACPARTRARPSRRSRAASRRGTRRASPRSARPCSTAASRWCRRRSSRSATASALESQGALLLAYHGGKLLEARWFADDVEREDAFFGEPEPEAPGAASLDAAFDAAAAASKTLRKAPDNDTLLALYSLYKQATRRRRRRASVPARSTWSTARNTTRGPAARGRVREDAMKAYVDLVAKLKDGGRRTLTAHALAAWLLQSAIARLSHHSLPVQTLPTMNPSQSQRIRRPHDQLRPRPDARAARLRQGDRLGRRRQRPNSVRHARVLHDAGADARRRGAAARTGDGRSPPATA